MYDTRIALTVAIQSCPTFERYTGGGVDTADFGSITGTGGAPGWYSAFISRFAGCYTTCLNQLPFDSPSELATIAPRGLLMEYDIRETDEFPWSGSNAYLAAKKIWTALGAPQNIGFFMGDHCHCMGDGEWNASLDFADKIWFNYIVHTPAANAINAVPAGGASDYNSMYYSGLPTTNNWPTPNLTTGGGGGLTPGAGSLKLLGVGK
jgi:hypothetical protein